MERQGRGGRKVSSRIFQSVIVQMKDATKRPIGVIDPDGTVIASSELSLIGSNIGSVPLFYEESGDKTFKENGRTYKALGAGASDDYAIFAEGEDDLAKTICIMASIAINEALGMVSGMLKSAVKTAGLTLVGSSNVLCA